MEFNYSNAIFGRPLENYIGSYIARHCSYVYGLLDDSHRAIRTYQPI